MELGSSTVADHWMITIVKCITVTILVVIVAGVILVVGGEETPRWLSSYACASNPTPLFVPPP